jgi:hypothetical protein
MLSHNGTIFRKVAQHTMCDMTFSTTFMWNICDSKNNSLSLSHTHTKASYYQFLTTVNLKMMQDLENIVHNGIWLISYKKCIKIIENIRTGCIKLWLYCTPFPWENILTMCWFSVCSTRETHRRYTGSQYGRKPDCRAVATLDKHWNTARMTLP